MKRIAAAFAGVLFLVCPAISFALEDVRSLTLQSAAVATGDGTALDVANFSSVAVQVTIANTATVTFEGSEDGATWVSKVCTSVADTSGALVSSASATGVYQCSVVGLAKFRARVSSWTSGSVTVHARATTADFGGGGGGGVSVAEDAAHSNGENIVPMGCRRKDTAATSAGTDGDWATVDCTANGGLAVEVINGSATVTEDGDIPASAASVAQTASVGYCGMVAHGSNPTAVAAPGWSRKSTTPHTICRGPHSRMPM